jgi:two-component system, OmpR family, catabolic regulation response regulator CreB
MMRARVLLVEDEAVVADTVVYALQTDGFEPEWVTTGAAALGALAREAADVVLLDVGLPDTSGFDLLREVRRLYPMLPILFLTARAEEMDRIVGLEIGADDYVVKPFSPREVSARVRAVLRRTRPEANAGVGVGAKTGATAGAAPGGITCTPSEATSGTTDGLAPGARGEAAPRPPASKVGEHPFTVDVQRRVFTYFGEALELTRTEYRLLEALLEHPGWIRTREQLLDRLWEDAGATTERAIDSHVKALRAKLRAVRPDVDAIVTHRGEGYAMRERW